MTERVSFMNTYIDLYDMDKTIEKIDSIIKLKKTGYQVSVNASKVNLLEKDLKLKKIIKNADVINADGISAILASKLLGKKIPERVSGVDVFLKLLKLSEEKSYSVYFIGAKQETLDKMNQEIRRQFPNLTISGSHNGYFDSEKNARIVSEINELQPNLIFLGFSSPKKEYWIEDNQSLITSSFIMGVGGSFDVVAGDKKRAPIFVQKLGLEWFFRFIQEPVRLFERYFVGNIKFLWLLLMYVIKVK